MLRFEDTYTVVLCISLKISKFWILLTHKIQQRKKNKFSNYQVLP